VADGAHLHLAARGLLDFLGKQAHGAALVGVVDQAVAETHDARLEVLGLNGACRHQYGQSAECKFDSHGCLLVDMGLPAPVLKMLRPAQCIQRSGASTICGKTTSSTASST